MLRQSPSEDHGSSVARGELVSRPMTEMLRPFATSLIEETTVGPKPFEGLVAELLQQIDFPMHTGELGLQTLSLLSRWQISAKELVDQLQRA